MSEFAGSKITKIIEKWYITEPVLFAVWTTHKTVIASHIKTIRVGSGLVEYNPVFINSLTKEALNDVIFYEAMRILLKHPYSRGKKIGELSYLASNITLQEYCDRKLHFPSAYEVFQSHQYDRKYFEFYYNKLLESAVPSSMQEKESEEKEKQSGLTDKNLQKESKSKIQGTFEEKKQSDLIDRNPKIENTNAKKNEGSLSGYLDKNICGHENTKNWDFNDFFTNVINQKIEDAILCRSWGTIAGNLKQIILASLKPQIDYKSILKSFRASILSVNRVLTRMKPSRRYEFQYMGSRRDFTTKLLFAVDVSGSVSDKSLQQAFSIVNRLFKYGIEEISVIQFDTEIKGEKLTLKKAANQVKIIGRGGTNFQPVMDYIEKHQEYDGLILFTDGYAPVPSRPKNKKTKILWLFDSQDSYKRMKKNLIQIGKAAFVKDSPTFL